MQPQVPITPRLIRLRDAPAYIGMDKNRFNAEVRPMLVEIPIGKQGIAFDRVDLDSWVDEYKRRKGRSCKSSNIGDLPWDENKKERLDLSKKAMSGISRRGANTFKTGDFEKALARLTSKKRKNT